MHDIAPRGFLSRSYVQHHGDLGLLEDVTNGSDNHILIALSHRGEDLPGNLVIGRESFDRSGEMGRRAVMSLAAASEQVDGTWTDAAEGMQRRGELSDESLHRIALLDAYGALIANTDRHQYNVSLFPAESGVYTVAPAFDQLPMTYAPPASGNLRNSANNDPRPAVNTLAIWWQAQELAAEFWRRASEQQLSDSMQAIVKEHASSPTR